MSGAAQGDALGARTISFRTHAIVDEAQGGLVAFTFSVPEPWKATGGIRWRYEDTQSPLQAWARAESPDGGAWVEAFPGQSFYWLEPDFGVPVGAKNLGSVHMPYMPIQEAMERFVVRPARGDRQNFRIVGVRPVPNLPEALGEKATPGEGIAVRVGYEQAGRSVEEEFYAYMTRERVPYHGPMGMSYQHNWWLTFVHSLGATDGQLDATKPLLAFIAMSFQRDPVWEQRAAQVRQQIQVEFDRMIARGYAQIQAAAALSRQISAQNDAVLQLVEQQRQESNRRLAAMNAAGGGAESAGAEFSDYIRGVERMEDPYWGSSEHSYDQQYHWTDGFGNYRHSNDPGYDPNIGSSQSWTRMEPAR